MARLPRAPFLIALLLCGVPLLVGQQERDDPEDTTGGDAADSEPTRTARSSLAVGHLARAGVLQEDARLRDAPFLVARRDGRATLGWVEFLPGRGDQIVLHTAAPEELAPLRPALLRIGTPGAAMLRPVAVADASDRLHVLWTELVEGVGQLRLAREEGGGFGEPRTLTDGPLVRMNCDAALAPDGRIWVAWEAEVAADGESRPQRDVFAAPLEDGVRLGAPIRISESPYADLDVTVVASGAQLWLAWASFLGRDYEIRLRALDPGSGALGPTIDVSARSDADDLHPALAAAQDGALWIAWDSASNPLRGDSTPPQLRLGRKRVDIEVAVRLARVADGQVTLPLARTPGVEPGTVEGAVGLSLAGGLPSLAIAADGRPWLAYRQLVGGSNRRAHGWSVLVQPLEAEGVAAPAEVAASLSTLAEPALAALGTRVVAAFTTDRRLDKDAGRELAPNTVADPLRRQGVLCDVWRGPFGIGVALPQPPEAPFELPRSAPLAPRLDAPHFHPAGAALQEDPLISGARHFEVERGEERWRVYWGDLHRHSCISRCSAGFEPTPQDRFASGRDVHLCDFMSLTDHAGQISPQAWWQIDKLTQLYHSPGFVTLAGYEWSTIKYGHHNVILPGRLTPFVGLISDLDALFDKLPANGAVTIPHHSSDNSFANDFTECDDRFTRLVEIYQARRGSFEFDGCFKQAPNAGTLGTFLQDALAQNHWYGIIASSDHAEGQAYACVLAERLDRQAIFDALRARRCYGATTKGMLVDLRVDQAVMGESVQVAGPPLVQLRARGAAELSEIVVFKNGKAWRRVGPAPAAEWNRFAPLRLQVAVEHAAAPLAQQVELTAKLERGRFQGVAERRPYARRNPAPLWRVAGADATWKAPQGFVAQPRFREFAVRLAGEIEDSVELGLPEGTRRIGLRELREAPLRGSLPGGAAYVVSLELGDGALDYQKGLGTREFTADWRDEELRAARTWYYARVIQTDGEIAWSSPIFVLEK